MPNRRRPRTIQQAGIRVEAGVFTIILLLYLQVHLDVRVNELAPQGIGDLFRNQPPPGCGADGAWRRLAALCVPGGSGKLPKKGDP